MSLTDKDLSAIEDLVVNVLEESYGVTEDTGLATKEDIKHLPSKDDFYDKMDEVMGELKVIRENQEALSSMHEKVNDNEERIDTIETKLQAQTT